MKPLTVMQLRIAINGELIQGSDDVIVKHGAYRIKQVKKPNTVLFSRKRIVSLKGLMEFFPIILVTDQETNHPNQINNLIIIKVKNTQVAYLQFIDYYRNLFELPVVAITGTSGKTTTKEMIRHILAADKKVTATNSTSNSRTAHLHYLLGIDDDTEVAVFETAVGAPGDVQKAGNIFKPTIGIITNIGAHHLNYCTTLESYIHAKGEMMDALNHTGVLIINAEDKNSKKIDLKRYRGRLITVGKNSSCHYKASEITYYKDGMQFNLNHKQKKYPMFVPGFGEHQVYNALAALAAAHEIGVSIEDAGDRLKTYPRYNKQLQVFEGINGSTLIDDTWSITTTSLEAALNVLNDISSGKKRVAIIGTITDLGSWGNIIHKEAGDLICEIGVDVLITIGMHAHIIANQAINKCPRTQVHAFNNNILSYELIYQIADENTIILIKGDMYSKPIIELAARLRKKD
ncbi:Mur ligase family protein [Sporosarcina sp. CAU 1771]